jgi:hypothetical protein
MVDCAEYSGLFGLNAKIAPVFAVPTNNISAM